MTQANAKEAVRRMYDQLARQFGPGYQGEGDYAPLIAAMLGRLRRGSAVLDLGCGRGVPVARALADAGHAVTGVDFSEGQLELARSLVPAALFRCADMTELELPQGMFDAVVCLHALFHIHLKEQARLLERIAWWLKPGGWLVATVGCWEWTGTEEDWPDDETPTWEGDVDAAIYRTWLEQAGLIVESEEFIADVDIGHLLFWARRA